MIPKAKLLLRLGKRQRALAPLLWLLLFALLLPAGAQTMLTPAGTLIRNHAIIQFQRDDDSGQVYEAPSNEVIIEVLPVYGLEVTPDGDAPPGTPGQTQRAISTTPNATAVFCYNLLFTGNIEDNAKIVPVFVDAHSTFLPKLPDGDTGFLIYQDCNDNGVADAEDLLVASWRDANGNGKMEPAEIQSNDMGTSFQPGESINLLLVARVPAGVPVDGVAYLGVEAISMGDPTVTDPVDSASIQNISKLQVISDAIMTLTKTSDVKELSQDDEIKYTLTGKSVGTIPAKTRTLTVDGNTDSHAGVVIFDPIPKLAENDAPLPVTSASIVSQPSGVSGTIIYSAQSNTELDVSDPSWQWHTTYVDGDTVIAYISSNGTGGNYELAVNESLSFEFVAKVPSNALDQTLINKAYASYDTNSLGPQTVKALNDISVAIFGACGVLIRDTDFEGSKPPLTPDNDSVADQQTINLAQAGTFVYFTNRVLNTGSFTNSFNITVHSSTVNPNGWTYSFFKSDGVTPLRDTGRDGIIDTGPLEPAGEDLDNPLAYADIVIRVQIPEDAAPTANDPEFSLVIQATSVLTMAVNDTTTDIIKTVEAASMSLDNHYPVGSQTPEPNPWQQVTDPSGVVDFPLIVRNLAPVNAEVDTYTLSTPGLPAGWKVSYYRDLNGDGILQANELLPVLRTAAVPPQGSDYLIARINIPADAVADADDDGVQDVHTLLFRATSTNRDSVYSEQNDTVVINWQERFELRPNRQGTIEAGGVTLYEHTVTNFGERGHRFFLTVTGGNDSWNYLLLENDSGDYLPKAIDPSDGQEKYYLELGQAGDADDAKSFRLRIYAPAGVPQGTVDVTSILVTANDPDTANVAFPTTALHLATDLTFVVAGDLVLNKSAVPAPGTPVLPGGTIVYTTKFFNKGTAALAQLSIQDQMSKHTAYVLQSATVPTPLPAGLDSVSFEISRDGGMNWSADDTGNNADSSVTNVRALFTGALAGGAEGLFEFTVKVR
jgi:uncharacterized repeat protein (TIGR01451 family)